MGTLRKQQICDFNTKSFQRRVIFLHNNIAPNGNSNQMWVKWLEETGSTHKTGKQGISPNKMCRQFYYGLFLISILIQITMLMFEMDP